MDEFNQRLCDERHEMVSDMSNKVDEVLIVTTRTEQKLDDHIGGHKMNWSKGIALATIIIAIAAIVVSVLAAKG